MAAGTHVEKDNYNQGMDNPAHEEMEDEKMEAYSEEKGTSHQEMPQPVRSESDDGSDEAEDSAKESLIKNLTKTPIKRSSKCNDVLSDPHFCYKFSKQTVLFFLWIAMGYGRGLGGPVLPDLKDQFNSDYEEIARVAASSSIGFVLGCFTGGIVHERWHKHTDIVMAVSILAGGAAQAVIPWMSSLGSLFPLFIVAGFAGAVQNAGGNTMVLDLWGEKAASAVFTLHLGFGIGAFLAPIVAEPFLSAKIGEMVVVANISGINALGNWTNGTQIEDIMHPVANISGINVTGNWTNGTQIQDIMRPARLAFPFALEGILDMFFAAAFMGYYFYGPPKGMPIKAGTSSIKALFNPGQCTAGNSIYGVLILILLFIFYIQAIGGELVFSQFLYTFATESDVHFTTAEAATLNAVFYLCHLLGRALGAIMSMCLSINVILLLDILGLIASTMYLAIFGYYQPLALWIGTALVGLLCSFVYPAGMIWANLHMDVNSMVVMVTMFGGAVGFIIYTYLGGYLIEYVSMRSFLYLEALYAIILAVVYVLMFLLGKRYGQKGKKKDFVDDDDDEDTVVEFTKVGTTDINHVDE